MPKRPPRRSTARPGGLAVLRPLVLDGNEISCGNRKHTGRVLTLLAGAGVTNAVCGQRCFWAVEGVPPTAVAALARQGVPGKRFRHRLPDGRELNGRLAPAKTAAGSSGGTPGSAAAAFAATAKAKSAGPRAAAGTAGTAAAAFHALAAGFQAVGAAAAATGQMTAAAASAVGAVSSVGVEGLKTARAGITAADNIGKREMTRLALESKKTDQAEKTPAPKTKPRPSKSGGGPPPGSGSPSP